MKNSVLKLVLIISTLAFISKSLKAQNDFVVTLNNDTLKGIISDNIFAEHRFKRSEDGKSKNIRTKDTKEYYIASTKRDYCAVKIPNGVSPIFLERIEKGKIELFELVQTRDSYSFGNPVVVNSSRSTYWYFSKNDSPLVILKHSNWLTFSKGKRKDEFYDLIKDNESLANTFQTEENFSFKRIRELVQIYNFDAAKNQE